MIVSTVILKQLTFSILSNMVQTVYKRLNTGELLGDLRDNYNKGEQLPGNLHPMQEKHKPHSPNCVSHMVSLTTSRAQLKKVISRPYRRAAQNTMSCNKLYEASMWASTKLTR